MRSRLSGPSSAFPPGVYLGDHVKPPDLKTSAPRTLTTDALRFTGDEHILTIGPTRSGKGRRLLAPNLIMDAGRSVLVVDPKGELAGWTADYRAKAGHEVVFLDPFHELPAHFKSSGFNPLLALDPRSPNFVDDAMGVAEALVMVEGSDPHWSASAQDLVAGLVMQECADEGRNASLRRVRKVLTLDVDSLAGLARMVCQNPAHEAIPNKLEKYSQASNSRELGSVISAAQTQTRFLDSPAVADDLERGTLDFAAMKERPITVYLVLPPARLSTHAKWLRLIIGAAIRGLQKTPRNRDRPDVMLILDEFPQLGRMEAIETSMALNAGYGIKIWAVVQHLNQLVHQYKENWETFLSGGLITSFGARDAYTSEYLSRLSGQKLVEMTSKSYGSRGDRTISTNEQWQALYMPHELRQMMPQGELLLFIPTPEGQAIRRSFARDFSDMPEVARHIRTA